MIKAGNIWWAMNVICTEEKGNAYRVLVGNPK
jgi:hypothetical protein